MEFSLQINARTGLSNSKVCSQAQSVKGLGKTVCPHLTKSWFGYFSSLPDQLTCSCFSVLESTRSLWQNCLSKCRVNFFLLKPELVTVSMDFLDCPSRPLSFVPISLRYFPEQFRKQDTLLGDGRSPPGYREP